MTTVSLRIKSAWGYVVEYAARDATALANGNGFGDPGEGDIRNAIAHAFTTANLAFSKKELFGVNDWIAGRLGDLKEVLPGGDDPADIFRDLYNNEVGLRITQWARDNNLDREALDDLIIDALNNGHLITDLEDDRIQYEESPVWSQPSENWEDASQGRDYTNVPSLVDDFVLPAIDRLSLPEHMLSGHAPFASAPNTSSPLVIDLDLDGVELTSFNAETTSTFFDIDNDGFAEQTAWVSADDALLARDINENGLIDNSGELFGGVSTDGFAALALLDSNGDLIIDQFDDSWDELLIWQDTNGDAVSQTEELTTLDVAGIKNIRLDLVTPSTTTIAGNPISHASSITWTNDSTSAVVDAWFVNSDINTVYRGDFSLDVRTLFMPNLRGYGEVADLHIAMSQNEDLLEEVRDFADNFSLADFADMAALDESIRDIFYRWTGVESVDPNSRGIYMDAQKLGFLEKIFGEEYEAIGSYPWPQAAVLLDTSWRIVFENLKTGLLLQVGGQELFGNATAYDFFTGEPEGTFLLDETAILDLANDAPSPGAVNEAYWLAITKFIDNVKGLENLTVDEEEWLDDAIYDSDPTLTWAEVVDIYEAQPSTSTINGTSGADTLNGTSAYEFIYGLDGADIINAGGGYDNVFGGNGNDEIHGGDGNDELSGDNNDDTLYGDAGNDTLRGEGGNDTLDGGAGGNYLYGWSGNDIYVYGGGDDWISDNSGTDELRLPSGIVSGDLTFHRISTGGSTSYFNDLLILIDGGGSIQIENQFATNGQQIETLRFNDNSTIDLTTLTNYTTMLTNGADTYSLQLTSAQNVDGRDGADSITTWSGNDTLNGGDGNDTLSGRAGNDTYIASAGFDHIVDNGSGTDTIVLPDSVTAGDITILRVANVSTGYFHDLKITVAGLGQIFVQGHYSGSSANVVENLYLESTSTNINLTTVQVETRGGSGNDEIYGITGTVDEIFNGMEGNDTLNGDAGNDSYWFSVGNDQIYETSGTETIEVRPDFDTSEITLSRIISGAQSHLVVSDNAGNSIKVLGHFDNSAQSIEAIHFQDSTTWTLSSLEVATYGTASVDYISGGLYGDASTGDTIYALGGNDYIWGDDGDDVIEGGAGNDYISGGSGTDTASYANAASAVTVSLATGSAQNTVGDGTDTLSSIENLTGSAFNDTLTGSTAANTIRGGDGNDTINGGDGNDILYGSGGQDTITGSTGGDIFVFENASAFSNVDTIADFNAGAGDKFDMNDVISPVFDPLQHTIDQFVDFRNDGGNSIMSIDRDGAGTTYGFVDVATLTGVNNLDETTLYNNGNLLAA